MDDSENVAYEYLLSLGIGSVIYEPDGKVPPDFLVNGRIAVEVRRLNQNEVTKTGISGLEEIRIPLHKNLVKLFSSLGPPKRGKSWFVSYQFSRPVLPKADLFRSVRAFLEAFRDGLIEDTECDIKDNFHIHLLPASSVQSVCFIPGGYMDLDSGGWIIPELERNIHICIEEKKNKVARVRTRYLEWWLVLIDYINYGMKESLHINHNWDKVILVDPRNPKHAYEV